MDDDERLEGEEEREDRINIMIMSKFQQKTKKKRDMTYQYSDENISHISALDGHDGR